MSEQYLSNEEWSAVFEGEQDVHPGPDGTYPVPEDMESASYYMTLRTRQADKIQATKDMFQNEINRIRDRMEAALEPMQKEQERLDRGVEGWHRAAFADKQVGLTVKFPSGKSSLRAGQPVTTVTEPGEYRAWLSMQPDPEGRPGKTMEDFVYPTKEPEFRVSQFKKAATLHKPKVKPEAGVTLKYVTDDMEVIPGIVAVTQQANHSIKSGG